MAAGGVPSYGAMIQFTPRRVMKLRCRDCAGKAPLHQDNECLCPPCRQKVLDGMTVYDRASGGTLPPNLARLYGRAL